MADWKSFMCLSQCLWLSFTNCIVGLMTRLLRSVGLVCAVMHNAIGCSKLLVKRPISGEFSKDRVSKLGSMIGDDCYRRAVPA